MPLTLHPVIVVNKNISRTKHPNDFKLGTPLTYMLRTALNVFGLDWIRCLVSTFEKPQFLEKIGGCCRFCRIVALKCGSTWMTSTSKNSKFYEKSKYDHTLLWHKQI